MALSLAQAQQQVSGASPAYGSNVASGNLLVLVGYSSSASPVTGITSTHGGTWTPVSGAQTGHGFTLQVWWAVAGSSGAETLTVTGGSYTEAYIYEVTGFVGTPSIDQATSANGNTGNPTAGPVTTLNAPEFAVAFALYSGSASSGAGGWTATVTPAANLVEYIFEPTNTAVTATANPTDTGWLMVLATFGAVNTTLVGESDAVFAASAAVAGSGALTGTSAASFYASLYVPQFAKLGDFDAQAFALTWFDGTQDVGGWWDRVDIPSGPPGAIQGASAVVFAASASPAGAGALAGSSAIVFAASATPTITGAASVIFAASAPGTGSGALVGASAAVFAASATVTGAGALAASSAVVFHASSTATLAGVSAAVFAASASLAGAGALAAASSAVFTATATPAASGLAGTSAVVFAARATPAAPPPPVVVGGQFTFGGSFQPQPLKKRKRRFRTASEILLEKERALRELEEAAAAAAAERQAAARVDLIPPTGRKFEAPEPAGPILGAALNVRVVDVVQSARGTSAHWGIASQVLPHGTVEQVRAEAAEARNVRLRRAMARAHLVQLSAAAAKDRNDTIAKIMAVRVPNK